jgi:hypothetical protein
MTMMTTMNFRSVRLVAMMKTTAERSKSTKNLEAAARTLCCLHLVHQRHQGEEEVLPPMVVMVGLQMMIVR